MPWGRGTDSRREHDVLESQKQARVSYEGLAFVEHGSALPGAALLVTGELRWRQQQPLHHDAQDDRYKVGVAVNCSCILDFVLLLFIVSITKT